MLLVAAYYLRREQYEMAWRDEVKKRISGTMVMVRKKCLMANSEAAHGTDMPSGFHSLWHCAVGAKISSIFVTQFSISQRRHRSCRVK